MATLIVIGYTAGGGLVMCAASLVLFECAVRCRSTFIAPRCTARPPETIYNPNPIHDCQKRGWPIFGWIGWVNSLSYETLLQGVPGTGTRKGGLEGIMLKVNMDGIVLLRFQYLCLKVCALITVLCIGIILPMNLTARCGYQHSSKAFSACFDPALTNLTDYQVTTLANIPELNSLENFKSMIHFEGWISARLYVVVLCTWVIYFVACVYMNLEWKTLLALRRVYYLEKDHWEERRRELEDSLLRSRGDIEGNKVMSNRDPWIPHPEQRDTAVNIDLYSVLVGGLPSVPQEEIDQEDIEAAIGLADMKRLDWQLAFATKYFDSCVPNPPGYSSSVAAITILPSASELANAWGKWYAAATELRRLRFIRKTIGEKIGYDINDHDDEEYEGVGDKEREKIENIVSESEKHGAKELHKQHKILGEENDQMLGEKIIDDSDKESVRKQHMIGQEIFRECHENQEYYRSVLGFDHGTSLGSFDFGPEQTAMYSREFAQGASNCCPNGCFDGRIRRANIDELRDMERDALERVHTANVLLHKAQVRAIENRQRYDKPLKGDCRENEDIAANGPTVQASYNADNQLELFGGVAAYRRKESLSIREHKLNEQGNYDWAVFQKIIESQSIKGAALNERLKQVYKRKLPRLVSDEFQSFGAEVKAVVKDHLVRESNYAVVTFISRQSAVTARQCLSDGRGQNRWITSNALPVPPLADAAPFNIFFCRGCCRPVSLSIRQGQKTTRKTLAIFLVVTIYIFYTIPLQAATSLLEPKSLDNIFPGYMASLENSWFKEIYSGLASGLIFSIFFSLCPVIFKFVANFGSNATSQFHAEYTAMKYFWWFYVVAAVWGNTLNTIILRALNKRIFQVDALEIVREIANTIPTQVSVTWMSWILVRSWIILPVHFLLQVNAYIFNFLGCKCCSRSVQGGGPGGQTPYRLYIDGGLVFLCATALAPASPLLAPCALIYFLICGPLTTRNLIFVYRPNLDAGGARWPFLFEILMSSIFVGQIMMCAMMTLKRAYGPALAAMIPFVPCIVFRDAMRYTYLRPFTDASLYHTAELDGLDLKEPTSPELRETYRRFLVDAHKAAYVPVCLTRSNSRNEAERSYVFTSEPACVVKHDLDPCETLYQATNDELQSSVTSSTHQQHPMEPEITNWQNASHKQSPRDSRIPVSHFLSSLEPYTQFGVSTRRVCSKNLLDLEKNGIHFHDDGSVTTSICSHRSTLPSAFKFHPQVSIDETDKND